VLGRRRDDRLLVEYEIPRRGFGEKEREDSDEKLSGKNGVWDRETGLTCHCESRTLRMGEMQVAVASVP